MIKSETRIDILDRDIYPAKSERPLGEEGYDVFRLIYSVSRVYAHGSIERRSCVMAFYFLENYLDSWLFVDEVAKAKVLRLANDAVKVLRNHEVDLAFLVDEISEMAGEVDKIGVAE